MQENIRKTKICFAITKGVWGGAQKYVYTLATSLPKDEYDVCVITGEGKILKNKLEEKGIRVYELTSLKRDISIIAEIKNFLLFIKIIRIEKPDILHLNSPKAGGLGALAGKITGVKKIIFTAHGWTFNENRGMVSTASISFLSWITVILSHKTIVVAPQEERQALDMPFVSRKKIVLIRNGIEQISFKEKLLAQKELTSLIPNNMSTWQVDMLWIGTIAELHKNKGLEYAIEAISKITTPKTSQSEVRSTAQDEQFRPFVYFIIGEGEERKNLENLIEKYNLKNKVFLLGFVDNANQYLKAFDVFILSSIKEGLPYTLLEAGYTGLPCVSTNVGGVPDIIENGVSGIIVTKARSGEITRALEYLISNPDKAKFFGENLKAKVEKDFSLDQMLEKTTSLYY